MLFTPGHRCRCFDPARPLDNFLCFRRPFLGGRVAAEGATIDGSFTSGFEKRFVGDYLWKIEKDADGFASLVRYRITS